MAGDDCPLNTPTPAGCCAWCSKRLAGRQRRWCSRTCSRTAVTEHRWTQARAAAMDEAALYECAHCGLCFPRNDVQINHIIPCKGKHAKWGCWHHSANLECLCKPCHLAATALQRAEGLI